MQIDVTSLKPNTHFCPSVSTGLFNLNANDFKVYMFIRSEYHSFVYQERKRQRLGGKGDYTLTCYCQTDEAIGERLGQSRGNINKAISRLVEQGLVIRLPFRGKQNRNRNLVVLDPALQDYHKVLFKCREILSGISDSSQIKRSIAAIDNYLIEPELTSASHLPEFVDDPY